MSDDAILETVKKSVADILPDVDPSKVTATAVLKDLGADSLQIVEIVSKCMRELKVKVPRSETAKIKDVQSLIDALARAKK